MNTLSQSHMSQDDSKTTHARYPVWKNVVPIPPEGLLWSVGGSSLELFFVVGDAWWQVMARHLAPESTVVDIGCGCGRAARVLLPHPSVRKYVGFDVIPESIAWCNTFIQPLFGDRASFIHYDLYSAEYNPRADMRASDLRFPCDDLSVDMVVAASVFTHLLESDARHYLREIGRVLTTRGRALLSIHNAVPEGVRFTGTETRIDIDTKYFLDLAAQAGLTEVDRIDDLCGQQLIVFGRK